MTSCLIEPLYLPSLAFFKLVENYDVIYVDGSQKFLKQTYRNRTKILMSNKVGQLVIPIKHDTLGTQLSDVEADFQERWNVVHWRSLQSSYGKTPFFEHYAPFLEKVFQNPPSNLVDLNVKLLKTIFKLLQLPVKVKVYSAEQVDDLRRKVHSKKCKVSLSNVFYNQAFGTAFVENLSILDALFNVGPEVKALIKNATIEIE